MFREKFPFKFTLMIKSNENATHYIIDETNNLRISDVKTKSSNHELCFIYGNLDYDVNAVHIKLRLLQRNLKIVAIEI